MQKNKETILRNHHRVLERISEAAKSVGRDPAGIKVVVVTKGQPPEVIRTLTDIGVKDIGENRVDEAVPKIITFTEHPGVQWHMVGHVQSRKARQVCQHFNMLHSLDSIKLAQRLDRFAGEFKIVLPLLLQFNVSGEETKSGWLALYKNNWAEFLPEVEVVLQLPNLDVRGLMTMAPYSPNPEDARPMFVRLRELRDYLVGQFPDTSWDELSMGMSGDFEVGVQEGATILRIGTAILGERNYHKIRN
jgi:pyridoxal phosphate enzyme (YggS family)